MEQIVQYWNPKNGEGQDLELPQSNGHSKEKRICGRLKMFILGLHGLVIRLSFE